MNIFKFELKMISKSVLIWSLGIAFGLVFYISFFPLMEADTEAFDQLMQEFPEEFLAFFGMSNELSFSTLIGYFTLTFSMIQIPIAIQALNYGLNMLSVEERELTADFLLTKPVTRRKIYFSKLFSTLIGLTVTNITIWIASIGILAIFDSKNAIPWNPVIMVLSTIVLFQLFFVSLGMIVSVSIKKFRSILSISMSLGFGFYIVNSLGEMFSSLAFKILTPYAYFAPSDIIIEERFNLFFLFLSLIITLCFFVGSFILYQRRNIASL